MSVHDQYARPVIRATPDGGFRVFLVPPSGDDEYVGYRSSLTRATKLAERATKRQHRDVSRYMRNATRIPAEFRR
ncbi:hypothetical protein [Pseudolysinimonas sp.]|uniref:hypothetical protein n=1 Tax=Pseudolysinimonas sp. TaxID=2680009 RepID=UPI003F7CD71E